MKKKLFTQLLKEADFRQLFNELGWDHINKTIPVEASDEIFELKGICNKRGFVVFHCSSGRDGDIADSSMRKKIEHRLKKLYFEHLIIFTNDSGSRQVWQLAIQEEHKPRQIHEVSWHRQQDSEILYQRLRGLLFKLDEEDSIALIDVTSRVKENFAKNTEKITKKFYGEFKRQHTAFLKFIEGIDDHIKDKNNTNKQWYTSIMLNRLMFCYFIQKKGFLNQDVHYLQNKLKESEKLSGDDQFYSFYRSFLLQLFHEGLARPKDIRKEQSKLPLGRIPYLNGGLFDIHELEQQFDDISISDAAFKKIFDFFDQWEWHLDTRVEATGRDINPDVIGYIFEKYINERADMGAYYTKEDITEYISKNTTIPYLFDETERHYKSAFKPDGQIWRMLQNSGDLYIYEAVKHGIPRNADGEVENWKHVDNWWESPVFNDLPEDIKAGLNPEQEDLVTLRRAWNVHAPESKALPTELWRELIERRKRYVEIRQQIENAEIIRMNDLITRNLNIRQFAQDVLESHDDPAFISHFYKSIAGDGKKRYPVSILDPTCGSGAFLFAALNILEPLYESCIERMRSFTQETETLNEGKSRAKYPFFNEVLEELSSTHHPNQKYYIYKSIILRNLYGVDIMKEAVEIAKLRLFLKLVGTVDANPRQPNFGLEPLPDIDFNIRAGNALVGIATEKEVDKLFDGRIDYDFDKPKVNEKSEQVSRAFNRYRDIQLKYGENFNDFKYSKDQLNLRLNELRDHLDVVIGKSYYPSQYKKKNWIETHQPFHWYAEFYDIIHDRKGFDVIIGNPPYVVYNKDKYYYKVIGYRTEVCSDLYAYVIERSLNIKKETSNLGMILPISLVSADGFDKLRSLLDNYNNENIFSNYAMRPSKLFNGADKHLSILISLNGKDSINYTSKYYRWFSEERNSLFSQIYYVKNNKKLLFNTSYPKLGSNLETKIIGKIKKHKPLSFNFSKSSNNVIYHTRKLRYFLQFLNKPPIIYEEDGSIRLSSEVKEIYFPNSLIKDASLSVYLSSLFFYFFILYSDCRNLNKREIYNFPLDFNKVTESNKHGLAKFGTKITKSLQEESHFMESTYKKYGRLKIQVFQPRKSKYIADSIDQILSSIYNFTQEELDFIINYDLKYRMGDELEADE